MSAELQLEAEYEPVEFSKLNGQYYQEEGPADYILGGLYALVAVGGNSDGFMELFAQGAEFRGLRLQPRQSEGDEAEGAARQQNDRFLDHFTRIEVHSLKHLAIETLLRLFIGAQDTAAVPLAGDLARDGSRQVQGNGQVVNVGREPGATGSRRGSCVPRQRSCGNGLAGRRI